MPEDSKHESKRDRVRRILINPLLRAGIRKQNRMKADEYSEMLVRLCDKLAYLSDGNLQGLEAMIVRHTKGKDRNQWPDEITILGWCYAIQSPPPRKCPYVVSVIQSEAGRRANEYGYLTELFMAARRYGPPFSKLDLNRIADEGRKNRAEKKRVQQMVDRGTAPLERQQWLDWYERHDREAKTIMDAKEQEGQAA